MGEDFDFPKATSLLCSSTEQTVVASSYLAVLCLIKEKHKTLLFVFWLFKLVTASFMPHALPDATHPFNLGLGHLALHPVAGNQPHAFHMTGKKPITDPPIPN